MMKPVPVPTNETAAFWEACAREELLIQHCRSCDKLQFYPRAHCVHCKSQDLDWQQASSRGTIASYTIVHRAPIAEFGVDCPYVIALVDLEEGIRMMMNVIGCDPESIAIGSAVRVVFERRGEASFLPQATLA